METPNNPETGTEKEPTPLETLWKNTTSTQRAVLLTLIQVNSRLNGLIMKENVIEHALSLADAIDKAANGEVEQLDPRFAESLGRRANRGGPTFAGVLHSFKQDLSNEELTYRQRLYQ